jgi:hypothetical protein
MFGHEMVRDHRVDAVVQHSLLRRGLWFLLTTKREAENEFAHSLSLSRKAGQARRGIKGEVKFR